MNILAVCGSLRETSSNRALIEAVRQLLPAVWQLKYFPINELPFFDPDLQFSESLPAIVKQFRAIAAQAEYLLISTPEYAHGIPGILKNSLEWLVCEETMKKKVIIIIGAPSGGEFVCNYLTETLRTMDMLPDPSRTLVVRNARKNIASDGHITEALLKADIKSLVEKSFT